MNVFICMLGRQTFLVVLMLVLVMAGCGGGQNSPASGLDLPEGEVGYEKEPASDEEIQTVLKGLTAEFEESVSPAMQAEINAYLADPNLENPEAGATHHVPASDADLLRMIGVKAFLMGEVDAAGWCFARAATETFQGNLSQVAFILNKIERFDEARALALKEASLYPDDPASATNLAFACWKLDDLDRAIYYQTRVVELTPEDPWAKVRLGDLYVDHGDPFSAHYLYKLASYRHPDDAEIAQRVEDTPFPVIPYAAGTTERTRRALEGDSLAAIVRDLMIPSQEAFDQANDKVDAGKQEALNLRQTESMTHLSDSLACSGECSNDDCRAQCLVNFCGRELVSHGHYATSMRTLSSGSEASIARYLASYRATVGWVLQMHRHDSEIPPSESEDLLVALKVTTNELLAILNFEYLGTQDTVALDLALAAQACEAASEYAATLAAEKRLYANPDTNLDLCLDGVLCFGMNSGALTVSGNFGLLAGDISYNAKTGEFVIGLGIGVKDPTGTLNASVTLKVSSEKGLGFGGDLRFGGPVSLKGSKDVYLTN